MTLPPMTSWGCSHTFPIQSSALYHLDRALGRGPHLPGATSLRAEVSIVLHNPFGRTFHAYRLLKRIMCDSASTSVTPALISMAITSVMKVFLMMKMETEGKMLSEEKEQRVMVKRVSRCRMNTGHKQKMWKADVDGA